jgi:hypoxanthine phosphoribosyltransferase
VTDVTRPATPAFAHASEAEMARILDFYGIAWEYEPHTFPILWNLDGDVIESFSPDFYLGELDLYLEMTTLRQKLVRKKNRKLRRLRELYPDVRIKLFYARDFRALMLKYGKLALADSLTGSAGQAGVPDGPGADDATEPEPAAVPVLEPGAGPEPLDAPTLRRTASRRRRRRRAAAAATSAPNHPDRPGNEQ